MNKKVLDYRFCALEKEIEKQSNLLQEMLIVLQKYPDAELAFANYAPEGTPGVFSASSIKNEDNLFLKFWGNWYELQFQFYTEIVCNSSNITVYGKPINLNLWQVPHSIYIIKNPCIVWNNIDKILQDLEYDEKYLKVIYAELILSMSKKA